MGAPRGNRNAAGPHKGVTKRSSLASIKRHVASQTRRQNKRDKFGNSQTIFFTQRENVKRIKSGKRTAKNIFPLTRKKK
jgi:hypothetical protein